MRPSYGKEKGAKNFLHSMFPQSKGKGVQKRKKERNCCSILCGIWAVQGWKQEWN